MKKDAYYFPHFSNARNDAKIIKLRRIIGLEGYAIYFMLLEILREQTNFKYPLAGIEDLSFEWHVSKEKIFSVITQFELFQVDKENFFSSKLIFYLQPYLEKTERAKLAASVRWSNTQRQIEYKPVADVDANAYPNAYPNAMQMQCGLECKESKGEERKEKENKKENKEKKPDEIEIKYQTRLGKIDPEIKRLFLLFCDQRKRQRKPVSSHAGYILLGDLWELSQEPAIQKKIIEQSIARSYQGFFPISGEKPSEPKKELNSSERLPYLN
jgi:hypothetical protein